MSIIYRPGDVLETAGRAIGFGIATTLSTYALISLFKDYTASKAKKKAATALSQLGLYGSAEAEVEARKEFYIKDMMSNIVSVMFDLARYYFLNFKSTQPAAIVGGIPLGTITELSHAMSNDLLKFRARGGIFLAHQEGGEQSLRIVGKAWGRNRFLFLIMIDLLFRYGSGSIVDVFSSFLKGDDVSRTTPHTITEDPWEPVNKYALSEGIQTLHRTFPVITRNRVYTNMYIETYEFRESVAFGKNVLDFTLFFRKNVIAAPEQFSKVVDQDSGKVMWFYREDNTDPLIQKLRRFDYFLDIGLSMALLTMRALLVASGNSIERTIAYSSTIKLCLDKEGSNSFDFTLKELIPALEQDDELVGFSINNKEELMQVG